MMTAEIAVWNRSGIALAADSAATTINGFSEKIYNNADKLFELSNDHPVAIMIYNNATLCNAPWELLIKSFRKQLPQKPYSSIKDYCDAFFDYIQKSKPIITENMRDEFLISTYTNAIMHKILQQVQYEDVTLFLKTNNSPPTPAQYQSFIESRANEALAKITNNNYFKDFDSSDFALAQQFFRNTIFQICSARIVPIIESDGGITYSQGMENALVELLATYTCKENDLDTYSGIVIAGYGDDEYYPVIQAHHVFGMFNNKLMIHSNKDKNNDDYWSGITPFAQDDEVHTFMKGCSKGIINCVHESLEISFNNLKVEVVNMLTYQNTSYNRVDIESAFDAVILPQINNAKFMVENHAVQNHVNKVLSILDSLAKVDLGYMAESLVNLTAFKRKVSNDSDSVGGPIDVAVLSKGDGFVWLKRKHYFDKDLNYKFFNRR
ncbi:hypothetical protein N5I62_03985 [Klebsiella quasipneumoniae]|uniref:hypothetical protein n=1 Tax=Klebsiella quasipneumoniae TaxID=1463165 RepID=UPI002245B420|nr:hypothetical protein [Klebsiella quasipneumoniae]MCW9408927.1 hypothetical protein [Klebsiella quasipneumoniae]